MKNISTFILSLFYITACFAQETVERKNKLTDSVIERFSALKTNKEIREGAYIAYFQRKTVVASGKYSNNKKAGTWNFYKPNGMLVQTYDYDKQQLTFLSRQDTMADFHYFVDEKLKDTDRLTMPVKIGGIYYGFIPYLTAFQLPFDTMGINTDEFDASVELLISPLGRLADYKVHVISAYYKYDHTFNLDVSLFAPEDRQFYAVNLNGKPILSRIIIRCYVSADGSLDYY